MIYNDPFMGITMCLSPDSMAKIHINTSIKNTSVVQANNININIK